MEAVANNIGVDTNQLPVDKTAGVKRKRSPVKRRSPKREPVTVEQASEVVARDPDQPIVPPPTIPGIQYSDWSNIY